MIEAKTETAEIPIKKAAQMGPPREEMKVGPPQKVNSRCNLLKHHRYLRPIMQPSDSTRKKGCETFVSAHIRKTQQ